MLRFISLGGFLSAICAPMSLMAAADEAPPEELPAAESSPLPADEPAADVRNDPPAQPSSGTAHAALHFRNDVGAGYELVEARFVMDGAELPTVVTNPARGKDQIVYAGAVKPGKHVVTTHLTYQGRSRGAFSYMKGYKLKVASDQVFTTPENRSLTFTIVGAERKGLTIPLEKRFAVSVEEHAGPPVAPHPTSVGVIGW
jgi:hypothetical protein